MNTEPINGWHQDDPEIRVPQHRLHNLDIPFPARPHVEQFGGELPSDAQFIRAYCYLKPGSALATTPVPPMKMLRLVFRCDQAEPGRIFAFLIAPGPIAVYQRDGVEFLDAVVDNQTGDPWSLWSIPVPERDS